MKLSQLISDGGEYEFRVTAGCVISRAEEARAENIPLVPEDGDCVGYRSFPRSCGTVDPEYTRVYRRTLLTNNRCRQFKGSNGHSIHPFFDLVDDICPGANKTRNSVSTVELSGESMRWVAILQEIIGHDHESIHKDIYCIPRISNLYSIC